MNKTEQSVRGRINATNIADLNPNKNALNANTKKSANPVSYTHLTLPTNREV